MQNDWDLELSHQIDYLPNLQQQPQLQPDIMLQPITTQQKFNINHKSNLSPSTNQKPDPNLEKQFQAVQQELVKQQPLKHSHDLVDEARKFRQYLNDKVQQLRKSKQQIHIHENISPQPKSKTSNLRKIINKQQLNSKQKFNQKIQSPFENANFSKQTNLTNKTTAQIKKPNETSASSVGTYKNMTVKKQENQKRFSNSQSSLAKNVEKKDPIQSKNTTVADIKKSINLDHNSKTPKLPQLTPKLKIPFPTKNQQNSTQQRLEKRKNTIDLVISKGPFERQKQRTPQSKNSFRIKRTSNAPNTQANIQVSQQKISIDMKKSNEVSLKTIEKEKEKQSPIHQGKNKKMREDFMRFNEQEKKIQDEILRHHQTTKQHLDAMMKKYQLSSDAYKKYDVRKQAEFPNEPQQVSTSPKKNQPKESRINLSEKQIPQQEVKKQPPLKKQQRKNKFLDDELHKINSLLKARQNNINKYQSRVERNPLMQFIMAMPEDILQQSEDQESDNVQQLPGQNALRSDPKYDAKEFSSTYSSVMTEMKNKKWGLKQRITFETHREQNDIVTGPKKSTHVNDSNTVSSSSKKQPQNSRFKQTTNEEENSEPYSKIQVNSRLKNLLLD